MLPDSMKRGNICLLFLNTKYSFHYQFFLSYGLELPESLPTGTSLPPFFRVSDIDFANNGKIVHFRIRGAESDVAYFAINDTSGVISLAKPLDYETKTQLEFELLAADGGDEPKWGSAKVTIFVSNINEYSPKFVGLPYEFYVQEKAVEGTSVGHVKAVDEDGNNIVYSINDGDHDFFTIESDTGRIYVSKPLVGRTHYSFIARATDDGLPQNFSLGVQITVRVQENNDYPPVFTANTYYGSVLERHESDQVIAKVKAIDKDLENNTITYSITGGNDDKFFTIDSSLGEIRIANGKGALLDFDERKQFSLLVQAKDSHQTPLVGLTIVVIDVKDISKDVTASH